MILAAVVLMSAAASGVGMRADLDFTLPYPDAAENGSIRTGHGEQNRHELNLVGGHDQTMWRVTLPSRPLRVTVAFDTWPTQTTLLRRFDQDTMLAVANAPHAGKDGNLFVVSTKTGQVDERLRFASSLIRRETGPVSWGVVDDKYYLVWHAQGMGGVTATEARCFPMPLQDKIDFARSLREGNQDYEARRRIGTSRAEFGQELLPLELFFSQYAYRMRDEWIVWFDLTFTDDASEIILAIVYDNEIHIWRSASGFDNEWRETATLETPIDGPFRILRARDTWFLIDSTGELYAGLENGHTRIGAIPGWGQEARDEVTFIYEDRIDGLIGIIRLRADDTIDVIAVDSEDQRARDSFRRDVTDEGVRSAIVTAAQVIRDEDNDG